MTKLYQWSDQDHLDLVEDHEVKRLGFKRCRPLLVSWQHKQGRYKLLKAGVAIPVAGAAKPKAEEAVRDGLAWLLRKRRLSPSQVRAAKFLRDLYLAADEGGLKSSLDIVEGRGIGVNVVEMGFTSQTSVRRVLLLVRFDWLGGVTDLLTVVEGVCGAGQTLRQLAGGDWRRAGELEAVLKVALDLVARRIDRAVKKAA